MLGYEVSESTVAKYLIRDRDGFYGKDVQQAIEFLGMKEKVISARSPWQNGYCERMVGTTKRECLHHMIIFSESHARSVLKKFFQYYHEDRTHLGLEKATPAGPQVESVAIGLVKCRPVLEIRLPITFQSGRAVKD